MNKHNLSTSSFKNKKPLLCFLAKGVLLLVVLFLFCFEIVMPQYLYGFNASIIDKVQRAESIKEPKILLIGNSNLVFGIDSEMIEEEIGMPVVNMGVHAGLGNAFLDNMSRYFVNEGEDVYKRQTQVMALTVGRLALDNGFYGSIPGDWLAPPPQNIQ